MNTSSKNSENQPRLAPPKTVVQLEKFANFMETELGITELNQFTAPEKFSYNMNSIFLGRDHEGNTRFIKTCRKTDICENEYLRSLELWQQSPEHFVRPLAYRIGKPFSFIISEYLPSEDLAKIMTRGQLSNEQKKGFLEDLYQIFKALQRAHVVHRDICPKNLLVYHGHLVLIDCQLAVRSDNYKEISFFPNIERVCRYNQKRSPKEILEWDDTRKFLELGQLFGPVPGNEARYQEIMAEFAAAKGLYKVKYALPPAAELIQRIKTCKIKSVLNIRSSKRKKYRKLAQVYRQLLKLEYNISAE